jgi:hypothetical protein
MNDATFAPGQIESVVAFVCDDAIPAARSQNGYGAFLAFRTHPASWQDCPAVGQACAVRGRRAFA